MVREIIQHKITWIYHHSRKRNKKINYAVNIASVLLAIYVLCIDRQVSGHRREEKHRGLAVLIGLIVKLSP